MSLFRTYMRERWTKMILMLTLALLAGMVPIEAQSGNVSLSRSDATVAQVFEQIESQTGYIFAVDNSKFDVSRRVALTKKEMSLNEVMTEILNGTDHTYIIVRSHILVLSKEPEESTPEPSKIYVAETIAPTQEIREEPRRPTEQAPKPLPMEPEQAVQEAAGTRGPFQFRSENVAFSIPGARTGLKNERIPSGLQTPSSSQRPRFAVKFNALYAATLTPNLGVEIGLGRRTTINLHGGYNPWNLNGSDANNDKIVHWVVQPEFRYWLCERFNGHFFGVHGIYSNFNVGGYDIPLLFEKEFRHEGYAVGGGISYGYHLMLNRRWGLEFTVGAGFLYMEYDKFDCITCGDPYGRMAKTYVGPTKAGVTLMFMIK